MHGLTGSHEPRNWRTDELLHVGDDLRHERDVGAKHGESEAPHRGLRGWIGRHLIGAGQAIAGETPRHPPCSYLP